MRIQSTEEREKRYFHRKKNYLLKKCEKLGIPCYEVGINESECYCMPDFYICILSPEEYMMGESFTEMAPSESLFVKECDYDKIATFM